MYTPKLLFLCLLLLATETLAIRLNYSAKYQGGKAATFVSKNAGTIDDAIGDNIVKHMGTWSSGKYIATKSELRNLVTVKNASAAASKGVANDEVAEMQSIVNKNTK
ncbi:hypothetical protein OCU04_008104 [Sclerotinia nivalis]|uniref:Uncharacterized protein n=1 Tax=Sclerotinia nivalis TaxID=352851 RepID=A0A9X0AHD3_9HELO|nr:hypothetical protein OCU04_008104 [Sclerotinia nivalis]